MAIICLKRPPVSLLLMWWFGVDALMSFANWWFCSSVEIRPLSPTSSDAHCVFSVAGFFVFALFSSPMLYYPHHYRERLRQWDMLVNRPHKKRKKGLRVWRKKTLIGVFTQYFIALPRFMVEFHMVYTYSFTCVLQGICIVLTFGTIAVGFLSVWGTYLWWMSKLFQRLSLNAMREEERLSYLEVYRRDREIQTDEGTGMPWVEGLPPPGFTSRPTLFYYFHPDDDYVVKDPSMKVGASRTIEPWETKDAHADTQDQKAMNPNHNLSGLHFAPIVVDPDLPTQFLPEGVLPIIQGADGGVEGGGIALGRVASGMPSGGAGGGSFATYPLPSNPPSQNPLADITNSIPVPTDAGGGHVVKGGGSPLHGGSGQLMRRIHTTASASPEPAVRSFGRAGSVGLQFSPAGPAASPALRDVGRSPSQGNIDRS